MLSFDPLDAPGFFSAADTTLDPRDVLSAILKFPQGYPT